MFCSFGYVSPLSSPSAQHVSFAAPEHLSSTDSSVQLISPIVSQQRRFCRCQLIWVTPRDIRVLHSCSFILFSHNSLVQPLPGRVLELLGCHQILIRWVEYDIGHIGERAPPVGGGVLGDRGMSVSSVWSVRKNRSCNWGAPEEDWVCRSSGSDWQGFVALDDGVAWCLVWRMWRTLAVGGGSRNSLCSDPAAQRLRFVCHCI